MEDCVWVEWLIQGILALIAAVAAIAAWRAAKASKQSADESRKTAISQVIVQITSEYASSDMLRGMKRLREWKNTHGVNFAEEFKARLDGKEGDAEELNEDRRRFSLHMHKIRLLSERGVIDQETVEALTMDKTSFFSEIIEPLEEILDPNYDRTTFTFFKTLFDKL